MFTEHIAEGRFKTLLLTFIEEQAIILCFSAFQTVITRVDYCVLTVFMMNVFTLVIVV